MCVGGRTYLVPAQEARRRERCHQKPPENSPASRPRSTSKASMASRKLVTTIRQTPLQPHTYCATAVARPSDAISGPDRAQPRLLCPPTRAARAALRGRTIIWHRQTPDRPRARELALNSSIRPKRRKSIFKKHTETPQARHGCENLKRKLTNVSQAGLGSLGLEKNH